MKNLFTVKTLILSILIMLVVTGCKSKNLISYIKETESVSGNTMGYIEMDKKEFKEMATKKNFATLMDYVKDQDYEYFIVAFENDKGLYCLKDSCLYENIEKSSNGSYIGSVKIYGKVQKDKDDVYKYKES